jgi:hypothetical protein
MGETHGRHGSHGRGAAAAARFTDLVVIDRFAVGSDGYPDEHVACHSGIGVALEPAGDLLAAVSELAVAEAGFFVLPWPDSGLSTIKRGKVSVQERAQRDGYRR